MTYKILPTATQQQQQPDHASQQQLATHPSRLVGSSASGVFSVDPTQGTLAPGAAVDVAVSFAPGAATRPGSPLAAAWLVDLPQQAPADAIVLHATGRASDRNAWIAPLHAGEAASAAVPAALAPDLVSPDLFSPLICSPAPPPKAVASAGTAPGAAVSVIEPLLPQQRNFLSTEDAYSFVFPASTGESAVAPTSVSFVVGCLTGSEGSPVVAAAGAAHLPAVTVRVALPSPTPVSASGNASSGAAAAAGGPQSAAVQPPPCTFSVEPAAAATPAGLVVAPGTRQVLTFKFAATGAAAVAAVAAAPSPPPAAAPPAPAAGGGSKGGGASGAKASSAAPAAAASVPTAPAAAAAPAKPAPVPLDLLPQHLRVALAAPPPAGAALAVGRWWSSEASITVSGGLAVAGAPEHKRCAVLLSGFVPS